MYAHIKFNRPKHFSQALSLEYVRQIGWLSSLFNSRKFLLLYLEAWKYICHFLMIVLYYSFLLNSYDVCSVEQDQSLDILTLYLLMDVETTWYY